ncbi:hypothetical protein GGS24DRAFT_137644 [Hypoxylon argillaceum]|nr:hypothetical protein GGS24DRAFT_137644 [Hypoxylon argillaceum]
MTPRWSCVWALLLLLHICSVVAGPLQVLQRDDITPTVTAAPTTTTSGTEGGNGETSSTSIDGTTSTQKSTAHTTTTTTATSTTAFASAINGNKPDNASSSATPSPNPEGQLPIQPRLSPGWGVAGALLLISGATYTLIGIKNASLHTFFSTAFLSGLSVTVLIVYVMDPPVPIAIEGAYVVAAVVSGLILGGAATVFHEITEGLGCLLGGFCISMWFLTLKAGGLLPSTASKVIFIAAFTVGSYGFYFSRHTRPYALMGLISFAGATVTVIGIDCFSRAGLKEFWAYIWNLNSDLFPDTADTYPLTKGIRVEIALTVVFTIAGIISQLRLWRVIQERRAKKAEVQAEAQRKRDEEEADRGLQIEAENARERQQWETVYGNQLPRSSAASGDSGVEDVDDEKKDGAGQTIVRQVSSNEDEIEMVELPTADPASSPDAAKKPADGIMTTQNDDSRVIIRVAKDDELSGNKDTAPISNSDEKVWIANGDGEARRSSVISPPTSQMPSKPSGPEITPLPFKIPNGLDENDSRSSIATYADEDDGNFVLSNKPSRLSLVNRLSASSGNLIHNLSQRSARPQAGKRKTGEFVVSQSPGWAESTEELVENSKRHSDGSSIAATIDGLSQDGDAYDYSTKSKADRMSIPAVMVDFGDALEINLDAENDGDNEMKLKPPSPAWRLDARPTSSAETVGTDILDSSFLNRSSGDLSKRGSLNQSTEKTETTNEISSPTDINAVEAVSETSKPSKSLAPSTASTNVSLTKDRLPSALPRVAMSYRTNEWAKHLSAAEAPPLEQLQLNEYSEQQSDEKQDVEVAAPVHVEALQQTAEGGAPPPPIIRSDSTASNLLQVSSPTQRSTSRTGSYYTPLKAHIPATLAILTSASSDAVVHPSSGKPTPVAVPQAGHSFRNRGRRTSTEVYNQPIQEENASQVLPVDQGVGSDGDGGSTPNSIPPSPTALAPVPGVVSYSSPQTLLGKREMFLRNKSQSQLFTAPPIQENPEYMTRSASQMAITSNYATPTPLMTQDADDIPLSQRKQLMRQSSVPSVNSTNSLGGQPQRKSSMNTTPLPASRTVPNIGTITAESSRFDSHQPQRHGQRFSQAERDARLSQFRQSVAADLRAAAAAAVPQQKGTSRETPLLQQSASSTSLLGGGPANTNAEIGRAIDMQRNALLSQREHEAQRREMERWEKERQERAFEELMRRGDLMDAHREALRRMEGGVKHG